MLHCLRGAARSWGLAIAALFGLESLAFTQPKPSGLDRFLEPQKLVVEIFHETGISKAEVVQALENGPVTLASIFAPGGIAIELAYRDEAIPEDTDYLDVQALQKESTDATWYVGILLAGESKPQGQGILSLMPDSKARRTAIVYMNASRETKNPASATFHSVAHELTHLLNLHHSDWDGTSFTQDSTIEGYASFDSVRWRLSESSVKHLRYAPNPFVRPGGVEFGIVLVDHASRHQPTPNESFDVVATLEDIGRRPVAARTPPPPPRPRSVGPTIVIGSELTDQQTTTREKVNVFLVVRAFEDSLAEIRVSLAGAGPGAERELRHLTNPNPDRQNLDLSVQLAPGTNRVIVSARDQSGHSTEESLTLVREDVPGKLLAVVFGVKEYTNVRPLKHSISDARSVRDLLLNLGLEKERLFYEEDPSLTKVRTGLGNWLRQQAGPKDVVFVYFAGHGAAEIDPVADDRDQLSKYLLPVEGDLANLYATALPMSEVSDILRKVKARTLVVILDTCFSGAAGGRTVAAESNRATSVLHNDFLEKNTGQGRVILSASGANEAAQEVDELGHGVFTFYLLEGLAGKADTHQDGQVDLLELAGWVSEKVRVKTSGKQKPQLWGEVREPPVLWRRPTDK